MDNISLKFKIITSILFNSVFLTKLANLIDIKTEKILYQKRYVREKYLSKVSFQVSFKVIVSCKSKWLQKRNEKFYLYKFY